MKRHLLFLFLFASLGLTGCNFTLAADVTPPPGYQQQPIAAAQVETTSGPLFPLIPPNPDSGKAIYLEKCEPCHGNSGLGDGSRSQDLPNPVPPIGSAEFARRASPAQWFTIVTQGNLERMMPPFASLTDRQRWDVVAYVYSLSINPDTVAQGAELFGQNCASCHGAAGEGDGPLAGSLTMPDLNDQEFAAAKSGVDFYRAIEEGISPGMPAFRDQLNEAEIWALSTFLRTLSFTKPITNVAEATPVLEETGSATEAPAETTLETPEATKAPVKTGVVGGVVKNASGGQLPVGENVMLHVFDQMQLVYTDTTQILEDGTYSFGGIEIQPGRSYLSTVDYDGIVYGSDLVQANSESSSVEMQVEVFDTTDDPSVLSIDRLHYFFEFLDQNTIRVVELLIISNPSEKTVKSPGENQPVVNFPLPTGASNLEFQEGDLGVRYVETENGFGDTIPIRPGSGSYQLLYSYEMPYNRKLELKRPMPLDTQAIVILVPEESVKIKGDQIVDAGMRSVQGVQYHMYNADGLKKGDEFQLIITGQPVGSGASLAASSNTDLFIGLGALGVVLVLAGAWLYQKNRLKNEPEDAQAAQEAYEEVDAERLMDAILALDDLYQEGQLPEEAYLQRRGQLKARLKELMGQQE